ncbi:unnamed protein product [Closterium sp. Naga37s-1]|nr:unnamed protein product [Closterium sp. Naga37s-1]
MRGEYVGAGIACAPGEHHCLIKALQLLAWQQRCSSSSLPFPAPQIPQSYPPCHSTACHPLLLVCAPRERACVAVTESTGVWGARASTAAARPLPASVCPTTALMANTVNWEAISSITVTGSNWRCKDVYTMYGLTLQQFTDMNEDIDCSALLPQGRELAVRELLQPCTAFYYIQPADTCSSVAQFLSITEKSLQQLNPDVRCPTRLPAFHALCVERDPAKARPRCVQEIRIGSVVDFKQVAAANGATVLDLCRLNPWISFRDSPREIDGVSLGCSTVKGVLI